MMIDERELARRLNSGNNLTNKLSQNPRASFYVPSQPKPAPTVPTQIVPTNVTNVEDDPSRVSQPSQASRAEVVSLPSARKEYTPRVESTELRVIAGTAARSGTPVKQVARDLGMTPNQVTGSANSKAEAVNARIESNLVRVREMALDKMLEAMGLMDDDKFANASLKDLAAVAGSLSRVIDKTMSKDTGPAVQLIVYAPERKQMNEYKVVDV